MALEEAGRVRFRAVLLTFLADLEGGTEALSEVEFLRWCRRHRLPKPSIRVRCDALGRRRYLDAEFRRADGSRLQVEVDGGIHLTLTTRWLDTAKDNLDTAKDNDDGLADRKTLRFPSVALYSDDPIALAQLRAGSG
jgi:hypothetical protein